MNDPDSRSIEELAEVLSLLSQLRELDKCGEAPALPPGVAELLSTNQDKLDSLLKSDTPDTMMALLTALRATADVSDATDELVPLTEVLNAVSERIVSADTPSTMLSLLTALKTTQT